MKQGLPVMPIATPPIMSHQHDFLNMTWTMISTKCVHVYIYVCRKAMKKKPWTWKKVKRVIWETLEGTKGRNDILQSQKQNKKQLKRIASLVWTSLTFWDSLVILFAKVLGNGLFISLIPAHILSTEFMVIKEINTRQESSVFKIREVSNIYTPLPVSQPCIQRKCSRYRLPLNSKKTQSFALQNTTHAPSPWQLL